MAQVEVTMTISPSSDLNCSPYEHWRLWSWSARNATFCEKFAEVTGTVFKRMQWLRQHWNFARQRVSP
jgi:hypothetical protein